VRTGGNEGGGDKAREQSGSDTRLPPWIPTAHERPAADGTPVRLGVDDEAEAAAGGELAEGRA
jgi:hypothetical protein